MERKRFGLLFLMVMLCVAVVAAPVTAMTVQIFIQDENGNDLNNVQVYFYKAVGWPPQVGNLYTKVTVNSGDSWTLADDNYVCKPVKDGYVSRYPTEDNRIPSGAKSVWLYMDKTGGAPGDPEPPDEPGIGYPVTLNCIDDSNNIMPGATFKIYSINPSTYQLISLVRTVNAPSGTAYITDLTGGYYAVECIKSGYSMKYPITETRFVNLWGAPYLNVAMKPDKPPWTLRAVDDNNVLVQNVVFKVYECDPTTLQQGALVLTTSPIPSGQTTITSLPAGYYCFEAVKDGYVMRYPPNQNRFQTMTQSGGSTTAILDKVDVFKAIIKPHDTTNNVPLSGVTLYIYEMESTTKVGSFVQKIPNVQYETSISLEPGNYCFAAYKAGYVQRFGMIDTRAVISQSSPTATVLIPFVEYTPPDVTTNAELLIDEDFAGFPTGWTQYGTPDEHQIYSANYLQLQTLAGDLKTRGCYVAYDETLTATMRAVFVVSPYTTSGVVGLHTGTVDNTDWLNTPGIWIEIDRQNKLAYTRVVETPGSIAYQWTEPIDYLADFAAYYAEIVLIGDSFLSVVKNSADEARPYTFHTHKLNINTLKPIVGMRTTSTTIQTVYIDGVQVWDLPDLAVGYPITIDLRDSYDDSNLADATVRIYYMEDGSLGPLYRTVSVPTGYIVLTDIPAGVWAIEGVKTSYSQNTTTINNRVDNRLSPSDITLVMDRTPIETTEAVEFRPYNIQGNVGLTDVTVSVYYCDPITLQQGALYNTYTVDYGDVIQIPRGYWCVGVEKTGMEQVYSIAETRFVNQAGVAVCLIPMRAVGAGEYNTVIRINDVDTGEKIDGVRVRIYEALPDYTLGRLVVDKVVDCDETITLPEGQYFASASKRGYEQHYEVVNTRVTVSAGVQSTLFIPMHKIGSIPGDDLGFLDRSVESIANLFGVTVAVGRLILGLLLASAIGLGVAKQLRGGAEEFGFGFLAGTILSVLIGLIPVWVFVLLVLIIGLYIGKMYMSGGGSNG